MDQNIKKIPWFFLNRSDGTNQAFYISNRINQEDQFTNSTASISINENFLVSITVDSTISYTKIINSIKIYNENYEKNIIISGSEINLSSYLKIGEKFNIIVSSNIFFHNIRRKVIRQEFRNIKKERTLLSDFLIEDGIIKKYIGIDRNIRLVLTKNDNIREIGDSLSGIFSERIVDSFILKTDGIIKLNKYCFSYDYSFPETVKKIVLINSSNEKPKDFFSEGCFLNCKNLVSLIGKNYFIFSGNVEKKVFSNCFDLEEFFDFYQKELETSFFIKNLKNIKENAFNNCRSLYKKNVFILSPETVVDQTSISTLINTVFIHDYDRNKDDKIYEEELRKKFYINESSSIYLRHENTSLKYSKPISEKKDIIYFWHEIGRKFIYIHVLKVITDEEDFSFNDSFYIPPYSIHKLAFSGSTNLKRIFIPKGCHLIENDVFLNCSDTEIFTEEYSKPEYWDEEWNKNSENTYCPVNWGSKGW